MMEMYKYLDFFFQTLFEERQTEAVSGCYGKRFLRLIPAVVSGDPSEMKTRWMLDNECRA